MTETVKRPLSRDLVLETAVSLVDHEGLGALSMRRLGQELGRRGDVALPPRGQQGGAARRHGRRRRRRDERRGRRRRRLRTRERDWAAALRARILTARTVMLRHKWAARGVRVADHAERAADRVLRGRGRPSCAPAASPTTWPTTRCTRSAAGRSGSARSSSTPARGGGDVEMSEAEMAAMAEPLPAPGRDARRGRARRPRLDPRLVRRPDGVRVRARPAARRVAGPARACLRSRLLADPTLWVHREVLHACWGRKPGGES